MVQQPSSPFIAAASAATRGSEGYSATAESSATTSPAPSEAHDSRCGSAAMTRAEAIADDCEARARYNLAHHAGSSSYVRSSETRFLLVRFGYRMGGRWVWEE